MNTQTLNQDRTQHYEEAIPAELVDLFALRVTALDYLNEASENEAYETMEEIIKYAREFGAQNSEIYRILGV